MSVIDYLVSQGRDPLEALFVPLPDDIAAMAADEDRIKADQKLVDRLDKYFSREEITRLREMFAEYERKHARKA